MKYRNKESGQSIIEVLIALAVFTLSVAAIGAMMLHSESVAQGGLFRTQATFLASEGLEAARSIRDGGFVNLIAGVHGLVLANGHWELSGTSDGDGQYTRTVTIADIDLHTKRVASTVTWKGNGSRDDVVEVVGDLTDR